MDIGWLVGCVFYVPLTARSFRDGTPIYCPLQRRRSLVNTTGNQTPGRRMPVHYSTAAPRKLLYWILSTVYYTCHYMKYLGCISMVQICTYIITTIYDLCVTAEFLHMWQLESLFYKIYVYKRCSCFMKRPSTQNASLTFYLKVKLNEIYHV